MGMPGMFRMTSGVMKCRWYESFRGKRAEQIATGLISSGRRGDGQKTTLAG